MVKRPSSQTQKGTLYGVEFMWKTGVAEEHVIGKEGLQETMRPVEDRRGNRMQ